MSTLAESIALDAIAEGLLEMSDAEREYFEERAAIMEYDGYLSRPQAEIDAYAETLRWQLTFACDSSSGHT
jgi:hypothetical protein